MWFTITINDCKTWSIFGRILCVNGEGGCRELPAAMAGRLVAEEEEEEEEEGRRWHRASPRPLIMQLAMCVYSNMALDLTISPLWCHFTPTDTYLPHLPSIFPGAVVLILGAMVPQRSIRGGGGARVRGLVCAHACFLSGLYFDFYTCAFAIEKTKDAPLYILCPDSILVEQYLAF